MSGPYGVTRIVVVVPMCPHEYLNPNARPHPMAKARRVKELRTAAKYAAVSVRNTCGGGVLFRGPVHVHPTIGWSKGRRTLDGDNALASLKSVFDGFTDGYLWGDDRECIYHPVEQMRDPEGLGFVRVELEGA